jgi:oligopeptide/dipeptide ABC transporter ATP-binding protein
MSDRLLRVENLRTWFDTPDGVARAVDGLSFSMRRGETLGLVGESGCGKSVTSLSIMGLLTGAWHHPTGQVWFEGRDVLGLPEPQRRALRGSAMAMVFQEPMTSLNPVYRVGAQVAEPLRRHKGLGRREAGLAAVALLERVGLPDPARRARDYPHQLSGGMKQRVLIAMALACEPRLLIADEPTTALDVTIQAQILDLLRDLQNDTGMAVLLITHDLGVVAELAHRVVVMYGGRAVETGDVGPVYDAPRHPYTQGLFRSLPTVTGPRGRLEPIAGMVPRATAYPEGCRFRNRCPLADRSCAEAMPELVTVTPGQGVACLKVQRA